MKISRIKIFFLTFALGLAASTQAQQTNQKTRELVAMPVPFFVPHWQVGLQAGGAYDVGEAKFTSLLSPALQATVDYHFTEYLGARFGLSGLWARNRYAYPEAKYRWNFIQPAIDAKLNVSNLLLGWDIERLYDVYALLGFGVAYEFNNDDAEAADRRFGIDFQKLWTDHRWNPVVRAGVAADFWLSDKVALGVEANANMLPDHFNSKRGGHDNRDWHFNALVGVKICLGPRNGFVDAQYRDRPQPIPQPVVEQPKRFQDDDAIAMTEYVQFELNKSVIRSSQYQKIIRVANYLNAHPKAHVELTGFADKLTGNATINQRLSVERAQAVSQFLVERGISRDRISKYAKGDRVQPFQVNEDNRVTICIVIEEDLKKQVK